MRCQNCSANVVSLIETKTYDYEWRPLVLNFCEDCHNYEARFSTQRHAPTAQDSRFIPVYRTTDKALATAIAESLVFLSALSNLGSLDWLVCLDTSLDTNIDRAIGYCLGFVSAYKQRG